MTQAVFVDAKGVVRQWINAQTMLVGAGHPLRLGAHFVHIRSPYEGAFALLSQVGGSDDFRAGWASRARISASIYGMTWQTATLAAVAYANALRSLAVGNTAMTGATCLTVESITGPLDSADRNEPRMLVDAVFVFRPAP